MSFHLIKENLNNNHESRTKEKEKRRKILHHKINEQINPLMRNKSLVTHALFAMRSTLLVVVIIAWK